MSILSDILEEEYSRFNSSIYAFEKKIDELPKGYIANKRIKSRDYSYLQWRSGEKVMSKYIKQAEFNDIKKKIELRKKYENDLKNMYHSRMEFEKVLGKEL